MRRSRQQLSEQETIKILENATSGVLALFDADDYTYALPISYVSVSYTHLTLPTIGG